MITFWSFRTEELLTCQIMTLNIFLRANTNQAAIQPTVRQYGLLWSLYPLGIWHPLTGLHSVVQSGMLFAANLKGLTAGGLSPLDNTDTKTIFVFRLRLYWLKLPYLLVDWVIFVGMPVGTDGRSVGRSVGRADGRAYGHMTTKMSRMHRLPNFLTHCAPLRALRARESSAIKSKTVGCVLCLSVLKSIKEQCSFLSV